MVWVRDLFYGGLMKRSILTSFVLFLSIFSSIVSFAQDKATMDLPGRQTTSVEKAKGLDADTDAQKILRLDLTLYREHGDVVGEKSRVKSLTNIYEIAARYYLSNAMYFEGAFSQVRGSSTTKSVESGSLSKSETSGETEPTLEFGITTSGATRFYTGLLYRFNLGAAKSFNEIESPKNGGSAYQPFIGLEADLPGYLFGTELRYTFEGQRSSISTGSDQTMKNGNETLLYTFIEQTSKYGPGFGFTYKRNYTTNVYDNIKLSAEDKSGHTVLGGEFYLQIPVYETLTMIPLINYTQVLDKEIQGEKQARNDTVTFVLTGRANF